VRTADQEVHVVVEMVLRGRAEQTIAAAFDGFEVTTTARDTLVRGEVVDHAALYGVIGRVQDLGLLLLELRTEGHG
jgi:hypothetical protein